MIVHGRLIGDAPFFAVHVQHARFGGIVWMLADTGASRTALLDRDSLSLRIPGDILIPADPPVVGIGGSAATYLVSDVEFTLTGETGLFVRKHDLCVVRHPLESLRTPERARMLRLPSVLGRGMIGPSRFTYESSSRTVTLEFGA